MSARNRPAAKATRRADRWERKLVPRVIDGRPLLVTRAEYDRYLTVTLTKVLGLIGFGVTVIGGAR